MAKDLTTYPVSKNGKFFGYATAAQIAASPSLELYDESKLKAEQAAKALDAARAEQAKKAAEVEKVESKGGADPAAVKKGPSRQSR